MKIRKPTTHLVDIGPLDHCMKLPTASRIAHGMKTICRSCGEPVTDEFFIAGFKEGQSNLILHRVCISPDEPALIALMQREAAHV